MKVGVYIPNRNHGHLIGRLLDDLVPQAPDEIVVVDDASTDDSVDVISRYEPVRLVRHPVKVEDHNLAIASIVEGMASDYLIGAGADDRVYEGLIDAVRTQAAIYRPGVVFTDYEVVDDLGQKIVTRTSGFSAVTYLSPSDVKDRLSVSCGMFECGVGAAVSKEAHRWLFENGAYGMGPWTDSVGFSAAACKFGAVYVPRTLAAFTVMRSGDNWHMRVHQDNELASRYRAGIARFFESPAVRDAVGPRCLSSIANRWGA